MAAFLAFSVTLRNAERLLAIVPDLLTTASGSVNLDHRELSIVELSDSVSKSVRPRAEATGIELRLDAADPVRGSFELVRVQQVLENLLSNANKYSPEGGTVTVRVRLEDELAAQDVLRSDR